jgi:DNA adenine methylase
VLNNPLLDPIAPARPVAPWVGGKRNLAKAIIARQQAVPHTAYVEPFIGMGGVFFRRHFKARAEIINDASRDVATLFRVLQRHYVAFLDMMKWQITSRAEFERLVATDPDTLTDLERAARLIYLQRTAYGGKVEGRNFGMHVTGPARFDITKLASLLEAAHERLAGVTIECLPWQKALARYDRPDTLFYLDPPYWGCEDYYGRELFRREEFEEMAEALAGLKGTWLLSLNDTPGVREVFGRFAIEVVDTTYSLAGPVRGASGGKVGEVLISPRALKPR